MEMKAGSITDATIDEPRSEVVVQLPNGQRMSVLNYYHDRNESGNYILVLAAGKKVKSQKY